MEISNIVFQKLTFEQMKELVNWAEKEGWNPGVNDSTIFWSTDPDGYYGIFHKSELIGGGALVSYNGVFGSMGLFIVKPAYRGTGYGNYLWYKRRDTLLARLNSGAAIGMDGVVPMQAFYKKGGFEIAFKDLRYERTGASFVADSRVDVFHENDLEDIKAYDLSCMGYQRDKFIEPWIKQQHAKTFIYREEQVLKGYAVIRKAVSGFRIGPLFADQSDAAESLYRACLDYAQNQQVYIDIPYCNPNALQLLEKYDANPIFECARMYYGTPPTLATDKIYGLTTLELG